MGQLLLFRVRPELPQRSRHGRSPMVGETRGLSAAASMTPAGGAHPGDFQRELDARNIRAKR
jgi:hypothetical protein